MDGNDAKTSATRSEVVPTVRESFAPDRLERNASRLERSVSMRLLSRLWKRHVMETPDRYRAYVSFPTGPDEPSLAEIHDRIGELERVFEGRLDVYARLRGVSVVTDSVPAAGFDPDAFSATLDRVEADYAETRRLARLEKWRSPDGHLVKSVVAVPVEPLFPRARSDRRRIRTPSD